jgi:small basic protein
VLLGDADDVMLVLVLVALALVRENTIPPCLLPSQSVAVLRALDSLGGH